MADRWGDVNQATAILSKNAGRDIDISYVRSLVRSGKVGCREKDGRTNEYNLTDCANYTVRRKRVKAVKEEERHADEQDPLALVG